MSANKIDVQDVYNRQGQLLGVFLSREIWDLVGDKLTSVINQAMQELDSGKKEPEIKEPIDEWNLLKQHWDFKYELSREVYCENCGNHTYNWEDDQPRKFKLKAANLGGLVTFQCLECQAKIVKKHFKDHIKVEVKPLKS